MLHSRGTTRTGRNTAAANFPFQATPPRGGTALDRRAEVPTPSPTCVGAAWDARGRLGILPPAPSRRASSTAAAPCRPPTAQNLKANPERQAKVKSELCKFYAQGGIDACPYGHKCNFAHGKHELKPRHDTLCLLESAGHIANATTYLSRPCMTWVMTGDCPFGNKCAAIHDPFVSGPVDCPAWLPSATSHTNVHDFIDRLAPHRENSVHQENPLVAQSIWEHCRPLSRGYHPQEQAWRDTVDLVCNSGVDVFRAGPAPLDRLSPLQKLCIVRLMRGGGGPCAPKSASSQVYRDYIFAPTHSLHSELCMLLQVRYFLLPDVDFATAAIVRPADVAIELTGDQYAARATLWKATGHVFHPSRFVIACEAAFGPKGHHEANVSIWFDAFPFLLGKTQIKRQRRIKQKKKTQLYTDFAGPHANSALLSRTSPEDFPTLPPDITPFVPMLPAEDQGESRALIMDIIEHRIHSLILGHYSHHSPVGGEQQQHLDLRLQQLRETWRGLAAFHEKWTWPKREGMGRVTASTMAPPGNIMPYIPLKTRRDSPCAGIWNAFVHTLGTAEAHRASRHASQNDRSQRLRVFLALGDDRSPARRDGEAGLSHILSKSGGGGKANDGASQQTVTWQDLLLAPPGGGEWERLLVTTKAGPLP